MKNIKVVLWDIEKIVPYELNAKIHDSKQVEKIAKSITDFGWDQPIVVDKDGVIIKGHGRTLAAKKLGLKQVPVLVRDDLTEEQVRAARLADNRVAIGNIDTDLLQKELATLEFDLEGIFDKKELDFLNADLGEMNMDAIVEDIDAEVERQAAETVNSLDDVDERDVRIDKALGFKSIRIKDERVVSRFMALLEAKYELTPEEAFIKHAMEFSHQ